MTQKEPSLKGTSSLSLEKLLKVETIEAERTKRPKITVLRFEPNRLSRDINESYHELKKS